MYGKVATNQTSEAKQNHYGIQIENRQTRLKTLHELIVDIEVIGVGVTQAEAVGILLIPGTATGRTRAAE